MDADPLFAIAQPARPTMTATSYFELARQKINRRTLRDCQAEAFEALANYYARGGDDAATIMAVGAGKTALGVLACLGFARQRAMIITPGSVIRGTFDRALDHRHRRTSSTACPGAHLSRLCRRQPSVSSTARTARSETSLGTSCSPQTSS